MSLKKQGPKLPAKHTHYVSTSNGAIYLAMTHDPGYEDRNATDWRPATPEEKARFERGDDAAEVFEELDLSDIGVDDGGFSTGGPAFDAPAPLTPSPVIPVAPVAPAAPIAPVVPVAPVAPIAPVPPAPTGNAE